MRGLGGHVDSLTAAVTVIDARLDAPVGGEVRDLDQPAARPVKGYASEAERFAKSRRKAQLEARLADATKRRAQGRPHIVAVGGRLWRGRANLDQAQMTRAQWERSWTDGRMFLTADGEGGKRFGNETIRVTDTGVLQVKVPGALAGDLGARLTITAPVSLSTHCGGEWSDRIIGNHAIQYDLHRSERGRWYLDASWSYTDAPTVPLAALQTRRTLGVDPNDGHAHGPGAPEPSPGPHPRRRQTSDGQDHSRVP
jgi:hypothetical protein